MSSSSNMGNVVESIDNPVDNLNSNVVSTISLLEAMRSASCRRVVFASTGGALWATPVHQS